MTGDASGAAPDDSRGAGADETVLDARGTRCPEPVLRLARAARTLPPGRTVVVLADDPAAATDVPAWCRMRRHTFLGERGAGVYVVRLGG